MKKHLFYSAFFALVMLLMQSCIKSGDNHAFQIYWPMTGTPVIYADDTVDSIFFSTMDSWEIESLNPDWLRFVDGEAKDWGTVKNDGFTVWLVSRKVYFDLNKSGKSRYGTVRLKTYEYSADIRYCQRPYFKYVNVLPTLNEEFGTYNILLEDSANVLQDSLIFELRNDWTMQVDSANLWLSINKNEGHSGLDTVRITFDGRNTTDEDREGLLHLTSSGITNTIKVKQLKKVKSEK